MTSRFTSLLTWIASLHVLVNKVACVCVCSRAYLQGFRALGTSCMFFFPFQVSRATRCCASSLLELYRTTMLKCSLEIRSTNN